MTDVTQPRREDLVGKTAFDNSGQKIGEVEHCYLDVDTDVPWWVAVKTGKLTSQSRLAPLTGAAVTAEGVGLAFTKDHIKAAPEVDLKKELDDQEEDQLLAHYGLTYPAAYSRAASAGVGDAAMTRSEEELQVGKVRREAGKARLRKYVVTEEVTTTVPVEREEVRVQREPIGAPNVDAAAVEPEISEEEHEVVLHEEEPVVAKQVVPKERVRLEKEAVTSEEQVSADLRKEHIEAEGER